jgi:hypothetical protein
MAIPSFLSTKSPLVVCRRGTCFESKAVRAVPKYLKVRQFTGLPLIFAKITELPPTCLIVTDLPPSTHHVPDGIS